MRRVICTENGVAGRGGAQMRGRCRLFVLAACAGSEEMADLGGFEKSLDGV